MKKFFVLALTAVVFMVASCTNCTKSTSEETDTTEVVTDTVFDVQDTLIVE